MSFVSKDNLTQIFQVIKNNFVRKDEIDNYDGFTKSPNVISNPNNQITIGTDKQLNSNHAFEIAQSTTNIPIKIEKVSSASTSSRTCYYCNTTNGTTPTFKIPDNYKVNYPTNCFTELSESISGVNFKVLNAISTLSYYVMYINIIDRNNIFVDITAEVSSIGIVTAECDTWFTDGTTLLNYDWYKANSQYVKSIKINNVEIDLSSVDENSFDCSHTPQYYNTITIQLKNGITSFSKMFKQCCVMDVDLRDKPESVIDFSNMFEGSSLYRFKLDKMPAYSNCDSMFKNCKKLASIISNTTCNSIKNLYHNDDWDLSDELADYELIDHFTSSITWMGDANWNSMFEGCESMTYIDLSDWKVANNSTITADRMFYDTNKHRIGTHEGYSDNTIVLPHASNNKPYINSAKKMFSGCKHLARIYTKFVKLKSIKHEGFEVYDPIIGLILHPDDVAYMNVTQYLLPDELDDNAKAFLKTIRGEFDLTEEDIIVPGVVFTQKAEETDMIGDFLDTNDYFEGMLTGEDFYIKTSYNLREYVEFGNNTYINNTNRWEFGGYTELENMMAGAAVACEEGYDYLYKYLTFSKEVGGSNIGECQLTMMVAPYHSDNNSYIELRKKLKNSINSINSTYTGTNVKYKYIYYLLYLWYRPAENLPDIDYTSTAAKQRSQLEKIINSYIYFYGNSIIED